MNTYNFYNPEVIGRFIAVDVHKNNNYVMNIRAEILHTIYTTDIDDKLFLGFSRICA